MPKGDGVKTAWTDAEKIIEKAGAIPWDSLELPEGRTLKAAQVMISKEKDKVKKAGAGADGESPTKKRAAGAKADGESPEKKAKPRAPRKNAKKGKAAGEEAAAGEDEEDAEAEGVKAEPEYEEGDGFET
ncbi:hypothetical protein LTR56_005279 [Elasticomyces elasticus]|nr:hypothetical protein LTR56_005279 [Elasticomyces elasticus]KAK4923655.1 hypothetical protein LTR49_009210 [Elasticomyces elasticus]